MLMVFAMGAHALLFPYDKITQSLQTMTTLTHMSLLSTSTAYNELAFNATYPEMPTLGRMDFVYGK